MLELGCTGHDTIRGALDTRYVDVEAALKVFGMCITTVEVRVRVRVRISAVALSLGEALLHLLPSEGHSDQGEVSGAPDSRLDPANADSHGAAHHKLQAGSTLGLGLLDIGVRFRVRYGSWLWFGHRYDSNVSSNKRCNEKDHHLQWGGSSP